MLKYITNTTGITRILIVITIAVSVHLIATLIRGLSKKHIFIRSSIPLVKVRTVASLLISAGLFVIYFAALGFILKEFNISLKAYLASASIIGLAVGFGLQGLVQDIVMGLTIILSDLFNIGDMVEITGQTGVIKNFGIRFTIMTNYLGADIFIPNRVIASVINYPRGYIRGFAEIQLPQDLNKKEEVKRISAVTANATFERFPGICIREPTLEGSYQTVLGKEYLRIKFRLWPGQGAPLENFFKREVLDALKRVMPDFEEWMVTFTYEVEKK